MSKSSLTYRKQISSYKDERSYSSGKSCRSLVDEYDDQFVRDRKEILCPHTTNRVLLLYRLSIPLLLENEFVYKRKGRGGENRVEVGATTRLCSNLPRFRDFTTVIFFVTGEKQNC